MKKIILVLFFGGLAVGGYFVVSRARLGISAFEGERASVPRGDLVVPITASGNIKPASVTQVKSKASGQVIKVPVEIGDRVRAGQLVIELLDVDERRTYEQAEAAFKKANIALDTARIALEHQLPTRVQRAEAALKQTEAQAIVAKSRYEYYYPKRPTQLGADSPITSEEWATYESSKLSSDAAVLGAQSDVEDARTAVKLGEQDVRQAQEAVKSAQAALNDANQRLIETKIYSPINGIVLDKKVQTGEVVQGGQMTLMGGTVLMEVADVDQVFAIVNVDEADIGQVRDLASDVVKGLVPAPPTAESKNHYVFPHQAGETQPAADKDAASTGSENRDADAPATQPGAPLATLPADTLDDGQLVTVTVETFPDEEFKGQIMRISPQSEIQAAVATFRVWIRLTSPNSEKLKRLLNTQAEAHFTARSVHNALLVKYDAVQKNPLGEDYGVYIPEIEPGTNRRKPKFVPCKFGADNGMEIEVRSGLKDGDEVYTKLPLKTKQEQEAEDKKSGG